MNRVQLFCALQTDRCLIASSSLSHNRALSFSQFSGSSPPERLFICTCARSNKGVYYHSFISHEPCSQQPCGYHTSLDTSSPVPEFLRCTSQHITTTSKALNNPIFLEIITGFHTQLCFAAMLVAKTTKCNLLFLIAWRGWSWLFIVFGKCHLW